MGFDDRCCTVTIGALARKKFRHWLDGLIFRGWPIRWKEDKGFVDSVFHIAGGYATLQEIDRLLKSGEWIGQ